MFRYGYTSGDVATRTRITTIADYTDYTDADFTGVAFSPDGRTLAYTSGNASVVLWDSGSRTVTARLTGHTQRVHTVAFSPDGNALAAGGSDQTAISHICAAVARDLTEDEWRRYLPSVPYPRTCQLG